MRSLNRDQLASVVARLLEQRPDLEDAVADLLPPPDLRPMEERLVFLKRQVFRALPNTRLESKTDSLAYNRVSGHLLALKREVCEQSKMLLDGRQWTACVDHALMAWTYVRATPVWDNPPHNNLRRGLMKALAQNCLHAIKKQDKWGPQVAADLRSKLAPLEKDSEDVKPCLRYLDGIIGETS